MDLLKRHNGLLRGFQLYRQRRNLFLHSRDSVDVAINGFGNGSLNLLPVDEIGDCESLDRLLDFVCTRGSGIKFGPSRGKSLRKFNGTGQVLHQRFKFDFAKPLDVRYLGVTLFDDARELLHQRLSFSRNTIEAAGQLVPATVAAVEHDLRLLAWQGIFRLAL